MVQLGLNFILLGSTSQGGCVCMVQLGLNFILLGSTKVVAIISIYHDLALGVPTRLLGNLLSLADRSRYTSPPPLPQMGPRVKQNAGGGVAIDVCLVYT
jgi:hypothetical protein